MTDRDRLIKLIQEAEDNYIVYEMVKVAHPVELFRSREEYIADHLIANGVIVLPCKVGDTVYRPSECLGVVQFVITSFNMYQSEMFFTDDSDNIIYLPDIGKTVFLTREEAEKALERSKGNAEEKE